MAYEQLKLENQLCFPLYAASRLVIQAYKPHLDKLGITYPQYLVLMVLWEKDGLNVNEISSQLFLNTNTVTPVLKRMEAQGIVSRQRSEEDERKVIVTLTPKGKQLQVEAASIPEKLSASLVADNLNIGDLQKLKEQLNVLVQTLANKPQ